MRAHVPSATAVSDRKAYQLLAPLARAKNHRAAGRQQAAIGRIVSVFQELLDRLDPEQLDRLAAEIEGVLEAPPADAPRASFARELAGGHDYSQEERVSLHLQTLVRSFRRREELLGDALTAPQVAQLLHTSRQTPHDRFASGTLLAAVDRGALRFPAWQFDPSGPNGVVAGLPAVIRAIDLPPLARINWFVSPNPYLEGRRPIDALKDGDLDRVLDAARGTGRR